MRAPVTIDSLRGKYGSVGGSEGGELGYYGEGEEEKVVGCWQASSPLQFRVLRWDPGCGVARSTAGCGVRRGGGCAQPILPRKQDYMHYLESVEAVGWW